MGSGTTAVAAALEGRKYIGLEISDEYCQLARQRVAQAIAMPVGAEDAGVPTLPDALAVRANLLNRPAVAR